MFDRLYHFYKDFAGQVFSVFVCPYAIVKIAVYLWIIIFKGSFLAIITSVSLKYTLTVLPILKYASDSGVSITIAVKVLVPTAILTNESESLP